MRQLYVHWDMKHLGSQEARKLLRIFRALQTSRVLHISMNARWLMNQLLRKKNYQCANTNVFIL